jgi:hypothetical protein
MVCRSILFVVAASGLSLAAAAQQPEAARLPRGDSPELAAGPARAVATSADRAAILQLVDRARTSSSLRTSGQAYDLKASFTVFSDGQTKYSGDWQLEEIYDPRLGLRWTASLPGSYSITRISSHGVRYGEETDSYVPLRLHEVRAALFDPLPSRKLANGAAVRTADAVLGGQQLTCVLLSSSGAQDANPRRRWTESEECVDPDTGFLRIHSQVPGRYFEYDYSDAVHVGGRVFPGRVTVHEAARVVTAISVDSVTEMQGADPALFVPTAAMKANGRPIQLGSAEKLFRVSPLSAPGGTPSTVCVFGVVNAAGQLEEAHSLQPSDPNSQAALEAAQKMSFSRPAAQGANPEQYFVFVVRKFVPSP